MPESEQKSELGGLAQSINALFSSGGPTSAVEQPEEEGLVAEAPDSAAHLDEPVADADDLVEELRGSVPESAEPLGIVEDTSVTPPVDVDPFASIDAVESLATDSFETDGPVEAEPDPTEVDDLHELVPTSAEGREGPEEDLAEEVGPEGVDGGASERDLAAAVDAFLDGQAGAAEEVDSIATKLREQLALDPLADAVERLVLAAGDEDGDDAVQMARRIVNPAVASKLVQRTALEQDEERRTWYLDLAKHIGTVMANAFKGALTSATDANTRRACRDGLIALGDVSRPVIEAMIGDDNRFLVQSGVAILGEVGGDGAVGLVTSALANTDYRVRREAIASLAKLGGEESGQLALASLEDSDPSVRAAAAEAAGTLGVERALRPILALLDEEDLPDELRIQVLRALGRLGDPGAVLAIEKRAVGSLFSKPSTEVRVEAYRALHEIGTPHAREVIEKATDDKDAVVRTTVRGFGQG